MKPRQECFIITCGVTLMIGISGLIIFFTSNGTQTTTSSSAQTAKTVKNTISSRGNELLTTIIATKKKSSPSKLSNLATATTSTTSTSSTTSTMSTTSGISQFTIKPSFDFSKIMVIGGFDNGTYLSSVEIIDYFSTNTSCNPIANIPLVAGDGIGGLNEDGNPEICGGYNLGKLCYVYINKKWQSSNPLTTRRLNVAGAFSAYSRTSPFKAFAVGGSMSKLGSNTVNTTEVLTSTGWNIINPKLPVNLRSSCLTVLDASNILITGGDVNGGISCKTFTLDLDVINPSWQSGDNLKDCRLLHACGIVRLSATSDKYGKIVAGGYPGVLSTEYQVIGKVSSWKYGYTMPLVVSAGASVQDPYGGLLIVGGDSVGGDSVGNQIFRLKFISSKWEILPQTLKTPRVLVMAFFIPDNITLCY